MPGVVCHSVQPEAVPRFVHVHARACGVGAHSRAHGTKGASGPRCSSEPVQMADDIELSRRRSALSTLRVVEESAIEIMEAEE
jgi:hypothetical protein